MKLKIREFNRLAKRKKYRNGTEFFIALGGTMCSYQAIKRGCRIGYEIVRRLYNTVGEEELIKIIDFEEESLNGFKNKYIQVGKCFY